MNDDVPPARPDLIVIPGGLDPSNDPLGSDDQAEPLLRDLLGAEAAHKVHDDGAVTVTYEDATPWLRARRYLARHQAMQRHPSARNR